MKLRAAGFFALLIGCCLAGGGGPLAAAERVTAKVDKASAWTGEPVRLIVTLFSPGPFSGTAGFDFPDIPRTVFLPLGSPLVGSESVDGETMLTQRHEIAIFTQQEGRIDIPAFNVRFEAKESFTSKAKPVEAKTPPVSFESKRPPGSEGMGLVMAVKSMDIQQSWTPSDAKEVTAGDVLLRKITRTAEGATAMLFPEIPDTAPEGVRAYFGEPIVEDKTERGEFKARRVDTIKYQPQEPGAYTLPELKFVWWNPGDDKIQSKTLPALEVNVVAAPGVVEAETETQPAESGSGYAWFAIALVAATILLLANRKSLMNRLGGGEEVGPSEADLAHAVREACGKNDAEAAYHAFLAWMGAVIPVDAGRDPWQIFWSEPEHEDLRDAWSDLSRRIYSPSPPPAAWNGQQFSTLFSDVRSRPRRHHRKSPPLPPLNP